MQFNISASITDSPILSSLDSTFREFKKAGVDGIELASGLKTRWRFDYIKELSQKYNLPITSFHQSFWSGYGVFFDERFFLKTQKLGVQTYVFHPLTFCKMHSKRMHRYLERLSSMQDKYGVTICIENMKNEKAYKLLYSHIKESRLHLQDIYDMAKQYDLSITFDTSHARLVTPSEEPIFQQMLPYVKNIHLSSFHGKKEHLPLTIGDFDTKTFLAYLAAKKYTKLLTFEVYYPRMVSLKKYDFSAIRSSIEFIRRVPYK